MSSLQSRKHLGYFHALDEPELRSQAVAALKRNAVSELRELLWADATQDSANDALCSALIASYGGPRERADRIRTLLQDLTR